MTIYFFHTFVVLQKLSEFISIILFPLRILNFHFVIKVRNQKLLIRMEKLILCHTVKSLTIYYNYSFFLKKSYSSLIYLSEKKFSDPIGHAIK